MRQHHDIVVIGGGQAGLAMSAVLQRRGLEHVVLERGQVGGRWRTERWDSLRFQFPNWSLELPGYAYAGNEPDGFALSVPDGTIHARQVVVATGPFQRPRVPELSQGVAPWVLQTDPTQYRRGEELPDGAVLVIGSGASGCQIGDELLRAGRTVFLSVSRHRRVPRRYRGKDVYWWLERIGRFAQIIDSFLERQWPSSTVVTGGRNGYDVNVRQEAAEGARVLGRVIGASNGTLTVARNANEVLDEADASFGGFLTAAGEFASANPNMDLADDESTDRAILRPRSARLSHSTYDRKT